MIKQPTSHKNTHYKSVTFIYYLVASLSSLCVHNTFYGAPDGLQTVIEHLHSDLYGRFTYQDQKERRQESSRVKESERAMEDERDAWVMESDVSAVERRKKKPLADSAYLDPYTSSASESLPHSHLSLFPFSVMDLR